MSPFDARAVKSEAADVNTLATTVSDAASIVLSPGGSIATLFPGIFVTTPPASARKDAVESGTNRKYSSISPFRSRLAPALTWLYTTTKF
jgi:hypothetical protein